MHDMYALMMDRMLREDVERRHHRESRPVPSPRARRRRVRRDVT